MIEAAVKELAKGPNLGVISTMLPSGFPSTQMMWVDCDDHCMLLNTETGRQKHRNIVRDRKVCVTIWDAQNPYRYVEVRGEFIGMITGKLAREHIDELSRKYTGKPFDDEWIGTERVILKIRPVRQRVSG